STATATHADRRSTFVTDNVAAINPALDSDISVSRISFGETVVDIRAQGVKRHFAVTSLFVASDFGTGQTARTQQADAFCAVFHGTLYRLAHGPAKSDATFDLLGNTFSDKLGIQVRLANLFDRNTHVVTYEF